MSENINYSEFKVMRYDVERLEFARHLNDVALCKQDQSSDDNIPDIQGSRPVQSLRGKFFLLLIKPFKFLSAKR